MDSQDLRKLLQLILSQIKGLDINWRLEGSANLLVQGVRTSVNDLDITTDTKGISLFRKALEKYIVKDYYSKERSAYFLKSNINGFEVEIITSNNEKEILNMLDKKQSFMWENIKLYILPLKYAKKFYEFIGRKEKVKLIEKYL